MSVSSMNRVMQGIRRVVDANDSCETDGDLLARFLSHSDSRAVSVLIRRHAPMVWGVCRRILIDHHHAEDAFQATFLVLLRKANTIKPRSMVGNWLHGVAFQTALKARAMTMKRSTRETPVATVPEPPAGATGDHPMLDFLDEELNRLPEKYRVVLVLCDLQGRTRAEAARELGWAIGTVASRLARGRQMLAKRLGRHGAVLSAAAISALVAHNAAPAAPVSVVASTIQAASTIASAKTLAAAGLSQHVITLADGVMKTMFLSKLKLAGVILTIAVLACFGVGSAIQMYAAEDLATSERPPNRSNQAAGKPEQKKAPKAEDDLARFQGTWKVVVVGLNGDDANLDIKPIEGIKSIRMIFKNGEFTVKAESNDGNKRGVPKEEKMTFRIDATKSPKELTLSDGNIEFKAIYRFDKNKLEFCYFGKPDSKRPLGFTVKDSGADDLPFLRRVLVREKPDPAPKLDIRKKADAAPLTKEPAWKTAFRKEYGLKDGELIRRVGPPYPECRAEHFREGVRAMYKRANRDAPEAKLDKDRSAEFTVFNWKDGWATAGWQTVCNSADEGVRLELLIEMVLGYPRTRIKSDAAILGRIVSGDFVVRAGADSEKVAAALEEILRRDCDLSVSLAVQEAERDVYVLSGKYEAKPLADRKKDQIEVYGFELSDPTMGGGGSGTLQEMADSLEGFIGARIVVGEVQDAPKKVMWHFNYRSPFTATQRAQDRNAEAVMKT